MDTTLVRALPLFHGLPRGRVAEVASVTDYVIVPAGKVLTRQGELADEFFVIVDGVVDVIRDEEIVGTLGPGDFFGEIGLVGQPYRTATVVAASELHVAVVARQHFRVLLQRFPDVARTVLAAGNRRLVRTLRQVERDDFAHE